MRELRGRHGIRFDPTEAELAVVLNMKHHAVTHVAPQEDEEDRGQGGLPSSHRADTRP